MKLEEKIEMHLNEKKDWNRNKWIKAVADALTGEIETLIEDRVTAEFEDDAKLQAPENTIITDGDIAKIINLAIKQINRNKVVRNIV